MNFSNSKGGQRPDLVPSQSFNGPPCKPVTLFNTHAFTHPVLGSLGDAGQSIVLGPGFQLCDV
jgi:hypothetical protein